MRPAIQVLHHPPQYYQGIRCRWSISCSPWPCHCSPKIPFSLPPRLAQNPLQAQTRLPYRGCRCMLSTQQMESTRTSWLKFVPTLFLPGSNLRGPTSSIIRSTAGWISALPPHRIKTIGFPGTVTVACDRPRPGRANGINLIVSRVLTRRDVKSKDGELCV